jgi:hypothetical protein
MSDAWAPSARLQELAQTVCRDELTSGEGAELESLLYDDRACRWYRDFCLLHAELRFITKAAKADALAQSQLRRRAKAGDEVTAADSSGPSMPKKSYGVPAVSPGWFPVSDSSAATGYFTSGWPAAYLIATIVLGLGLLIGAVTHISRPEQIVQDALPSPSGRGAGGEGGDRLNSPSSCIVGQITETVDCRFVAGSRSKALRPKTAVSLGDKFVLRSGVMEIAYDTGASVILQGPVTYEVESPAGGFLFLGRLTARVENKTTQDQRPKTKDQSPKSETISKSPNLQISKFVVRTPIAVVTDLGTEFGVEVAKSGETTSHVFRGAIRVQKAGADGTVAPDGRIVRENQSVRVEGSPGNRQIVSLRAFASARFVREIPKQRIKVLDLVDVLAGGDGYSERRNKGIDPISGRLVDSLDTIAAKPWSGDGRYHRVAGRPMVDGVFVPNGGSRAVQVDSAGHTFDEFLETSNKTWQYVWAGGLLPIDEVPTVIDGVDYASSGHGLIYLNGDSAITFNLEAIRRANPGYRPLRFRATAANMGPDINGYADVWILVDGRKRFQRRQINSSSGAFSAVVPIGKEDRFLTLAATDGGDGISHDWILFGDPQLELLKIEARTVTPE